MLAIQCEDQPGIVHAISTAVVAVGGNILENDQFTDPVTNLFCMRTRFETVAGNVEDVRNRLMTDLSRFAPALGLRSENVRRRVLIMVSTSDHCLADLLYRRENGDIPIDVAAPSDLVALGRDVERVVLARAVKLIAEDRVSLVGRRTVIFSQ